MKVFCLINTDNGWDNVVGIADSLESLAFYMECESVEVLHQMINDIPTMILKSAVVETLPEDSLQESIEKHW